MGADHSTDGLHHRLLQMQVLRYIAGKGADALGAAGIADYDGPCFINAAAPVDSFKNGDICAGHATGFVHHAQLAAGVQRKHGLDAQQAAGDGNCAGKASALVQVFQRVTTAYRRRWVRAVSRSATMSMAEKPSATR